jgi:oligopeptide/dipeptide ABC transporter ATP-binding protein
VESLLDVKNLKVEFQVNGTYVPVIENLSFSVGKHEAFGIVGESGSGKSVTSLSIMRLLPQTGCRVEGEILFNGRNLLALEEKEMEEIRGNRIAMIFQEPMTSLNPVHTCGRQIAESILLHTKTPKKEAMDKALTLLKLCGIPDAEQRMREYPHQLSGGMRQRIMIAMALACDPELLIADEPTTALDVTIQAQILQLLRDLRAEKKMSVIMITHDLGIVSDFCDRVAVVYTGQAVEIAPTRQLFQEPLHPYTEGLIRALPRLGCEEKRLDTIPGMVPDAGDMPEGCHFHPRCRYATERCRQEKPSLSILPDGRCVRCFRAGSEKEG